MGAHTLVPWLRRKTKKRNVQCGCIGKTGQRMIFLLSCLMCFFLLFLNKHCFNLNGKKITTRLEKRAREPFLCHRVFPQTGVGWGGVGRGGCSEKKPPFRSEARVGKPEPSGQWPVASGRVSRPGGSCADSDKATFSLHGAQWGVLDAAASAKHPQTPSLGRQPV